MRVLGKREKEGGEGGIKTKRKRRTGNERVKKRVIVHVCMCLDGGINLCHGLL